MFPVIQLGPLAIQTGGLIALLGLWVGLSLSDKFCREFSIEPQTLDKFFILSMIAGVIGARLMYILRYPSAFISSPQSIVSINPGLFDLGGGLATTLFFALIYIHRKSMNWYSVADALTPLFATLSISFAIVHLANGDAYGIPTKLPWAIYQWGAYRHPSQVYEIIASSAIFSIVLYRIHHKRNTFAGVAFFSFLAYTASTRLFLAGYRGDSQVLWGGFRIEQLLAWLVLASCLLTLERRGRVGDGING